MEVPSPFPTSQHVPKPNPPKSRDACIADLETAFEGDQIADAKRFTVQLRYSDRMCEEIDDAVFEGEGQKR